MKFIFPLLFLPIALDAQVRGNVNYDKVEANAPASGNYNYNANSNLYGQYKVNSGVPSAEVLENNVVTIKASVLYNAHADEYVAMFNVNQVEATVESANTAINQRIYGLKAELLKMGILEKDIFLDMISQVPVYEYDTEKKLFSKSFNEVPKGFELQKNLHIRFTKPEVLDGMLSAAAKYEIYDLVKVDYHKDNVDAVYDSMRVQAIRCINNKKEDFKKLGIDLTNDYKVLADASNVTSPLERYSSYQAFTASSLPGGAGGKVTNYRKNTTHYYNPIPEKGFDVVINPTILEPAIQYTYTLTVKVIREMPLPKEVQKEIYLVQPDGTVKQIKF